MTSKKEVVERTPQEILIAYCSTLSSKKAKEAYQILLERFEIHRARCLTFNRAGQECPPPYGKIRLTPNQYQRILSENGEVAFHAMCELLYDYIVYLEERAPVELIARQRLKEYKKISHYYKMTKGWVAQKYYEVHPEQAITETKNIPRFEMIENKKQAIEYIKSIPQELRYDNQDIVFLTMQYKITEDDING